MMLYEVLLVAVIALLIVIIPVVVAIAVLLWKLVWEVAKWPVAHSLMERLLKLLLESADEKA